MAARLRAELRDLLRPTLTCDTSDLPFGLVGPAEAAIGKDAPAGAGRQFPRGAKAAADPAGWPACMSRLLLRLKALAQVFQACSQRPAPSRPPETLRQFAARARQSKLGRSGSGCACSRPAARGHGSKRGRRCSFQRQRNSDVTSEHETCPERKRPATGQVTGPWTWSVPVGVGHAAAVRIMPVALNAG